MFLTDSLLRVLPNLISLFKKNIRYKGLGLVLERCRFNSYFDVSFQYGKVKQIRLVTNRAGKPKGFGYVELEDEVSKYVVHVSDGLSIGFQLTYGRVRVIVQNYNVLGFRVLDFFCVRFEQRTYARICA